MAAEAAGEGQDSSVSTALAMKRCKRGRGQGKEGEPGGAEATGKNDSFVQFLVCHKILMV